MKLVLASGSSYRRELMGRLGVAFEVQPSSVDETRLPHEAPAALASRLAREKARAVARETGGYVIGSDQVIALGDEVFHKPGTPERAEAQLAALSGRAHALITAVVVVAPDGREASETMVHEMVMRHLEEDEIRRYVAEDAPLDCAGSYKIEAGGIRLFESLRGDDYTGIVGLPLTTVRRLLDSLGFGWTQ